MSLADELLADLEDLGGPEPETEVVPKKEFDGLVVPKTEPQDEEAMETEDSDPLAAAAKLYGSEKLEGVMTAIDECMANPRKADQISGPVEADPEYLLIVEANNLTVEIDNDISSLHKFVRDRYSKRFPELESLVPTPLEYLMTAKELGNDLESAKNNEFLAQYITQATIMILSVTASTTQGTKMEPEELELVRQGCVRAMELHECRKKIFQYVESRMSFIAPNLSQVVGPATAAQMMGVAGGLTNLSKMPACNVMLLGQQKKILSGFSQVATLPNTGYIYYSPLVQDLPPDLRRKAARVMAAKCTLAARVDACHESPDGSIGRSLREQVDKKYDKWQEPPPVKAIKPLPAPIEAPRKKRGGKRVRRMKEKFAQTELRKQANRMNFGDIDDDAYQDDLGLSLGQIKKSGGSIRGPVVDDRSRVRISKALQKTLQKANAYASSTPAGAATAVIRTGTSIIGSTVRGMGGKSAVSGTASSVAFTPLQGLEIVNPHAAERRGDDSTAKYFSSTAGFINVKNTK